MFDQMLKFHTFPIRVFDEESEYEFKMWNAWGTRCQKLEEENKNNEMKKFMNGNIDVLVSTTVVEVGIDNPNVNVILINNSERFGLSQLHQLRGRVGRGILESYCLLCSDSESPKTKERLNIIVNSRNGFDIADEDLKLRGPGEFFGEKQSGFVKFKIADLIKIKRSTANQIKVKTN